MTKIFKPMSFSRSPSMKNRFMLAPLTNSQSNGDGTLSEDEYKWLSMRAKGGFGLTMTCAAHVQAVGQGFPGQLGIFSDDHLGGLSKLAKGILAEDSLAVAQLHHAGMRSPKALVGDNIVCPSDNEETGARGLSIQEIEQLIEDFICAAVRAERAGFSGVEIHGAHGYILCQFLSPTINKRTDCYGGTLENRARILFDIIRGIRERCQPNFLIGVRLSPERFDVVLTEIIELARRLMAEAQIDFLDMSLWDVFKEPNEEAFKGRTLMSYFTELKRGSVRLGVAGKIRTPEEAVTCIEQGVDFILLGRAAILHHDYPLLMQANSDFTPVKNPVSVDYLRRQGLGEDFIKYMSSWKGFVENT